MIQLYLIRHGKTIANEKKLYCGFSDLPLSSLGKKELKKLKNIYTPCQIYFTSGLLRCNETLELIQSKDTPFEVIHSLREINLGRFELKSYEQLKADKEYIRWISDKTGDIKCPSGESKNDFNQRVAIGFLSLTNKLLNSQENVAMCITHGGVIVSIMESLFGVSKNFYQWQPETGLGYMLVHDGKTGYISYEKLRV